MNVCLTTVMLLTRCKCTCICAVAAVMLNTGNKASKKELMQHASFNHKKQAAFKTVTTVLWSKLSINVWDKIWLFYWTYIYINTHTHTHTNTIIPSFSVQMHLSSCKCSNYWFQLWCLLYNCAGRQCELMTSVQMGNWEFRFQLCHPVFGLCPIT